MVDNSGLEPDAERRASSSLAPCTITAISHLAYRWFKDVQQINKKMRSSQNRRAARFLGVTKERWYQR